MTDQPRSGRPEYEIHLVGDAPAELDVESPVPTRRIDYYDSGVWIDREGDRLFLPYERVFAIRETGSGESATGESASDSEAASGTEGRADATGGAKTGGSPAAAEVGDDAQGAVDTAPEAAETGSSEAAGGEAVETSSEAADETQATSERD